MRFLLAAVLFFLVAQLQGQIIQDSIHNKKNGSSIPDSLMNKGNISDPLYLIKGRVSGLTMSRGSGHSMNYESVFIRGLSSRGWSSTPLYVIDGIPFASPYNLFPEDIKSFTVYKNVSNTAKYGIYGGNGVIEIETKNVNDSAFHVSYHSILSFDEPSNRLDLLGANEYRAKVDEFDWNEYFDDLGGNTDWQNEAFSPVVSHQQNIIVSQQVKNTKYRFSLSFIDQPGLLIRSGKEKIGGNGFVNQSLLDDKLNINFSFNLSRQNYKGISLNDADIVLYQVYTRLPTNPINMDMPEWIDIFHSRFGEFDPVTFINSYQNKEKEDRQLFNLNLNYSLNDEITFTISSGFQSFAQERVLNLEESLNNYSIRFNEMDRHITDENYYFSTRATYHKILDHSVLDLSLNYSYFRNNYFGDTLLYTYYYQKNREITNAIVGNIQYMHETGFNFNWTSRYDKQNIETSESYRDEYWSHGLSLGWNIKKLSILKNIDKLDYLNLKYNIGHAYSKPIPNRTNYNVYGYQFFSDYLPTSEQSFSLKSSAFSHRLNISFNVYKRETVNTHNFKIWALYHPYYLPYTYTVENKGIELDVNYLVLSKKQITWRTNFNFFKNKNMVTRTEGVLIPEIYSEFGNQILEEGSSIYTFYLPDFAHTFDFYMFFYDENGEITEDEWAARKVRASIFPDFQLGWQNYFTLGQFSLSFSMRYVHGNHIYNFDRYILSKYMLTENNVLASEMEIPLHEIIESDLYLEDASYLRLDNLTLGYKFSFEKFNLNNFFEVYIGANNLLTLTYFDGLNPEIDYERPISPTDYYGYSYSYEDWTGNSTTSGYPALRSYFVGVKVYF